MISYIKYPIFPGDDTHGTPSRTYPQHTGCSPRPGRRSSARHPNVEHKPSPTRSTTGSSFHRLRPSISGCQPSALQHFPVRGDVGAIHGNLVRRRRLKTYLFTQSYSDKHMYQLVFYCFTVLFAVLQWSLQYSCSGHFFEILFD